MSGTLLEGGDGSDERLDGSRGRLRLESTRNARLRAAFSLERANQRKERGLSLLEGLRFVEDCLESGARIEDLFLDESLPPSKVERLLRLAGSMDVRVFDVARGVLERLSEQSVGDGVAATVWIPRPAPDLLRGAQLLVVCHGIQNPGNLGAIVRVSAAMGVGGMLVSGGADPYAPKALRGAAGTTFRLPVLREERPFEVLIQELLEWGHEILVADAREGQPHLRLSDASGQGRKSALILGSEGQGLRVSLPAAARRVRIDLAGGVESLNVAVAAGILLDRLRVPRNS